MTKLHEVKAEIANKIKSSKAIAVDVDGTLTEETGEISLQAISALREMKKKFRLKIVLASGNSYPVLMGLARYIGSVDLVIAENGGVVGYGSKFKVNGNRDIGLRARELVKRRLNHILAESWQNQFRFVDFAFKLRKGHSWSEAVKLVSNLIEKEIPEATSTFSGVAIHVKDRSVNKGLGLKVASEMIGISTKEFIAIGDSDVDVEMMIEAGISIAVANASPKALKVADLVTTKPYADGFMEFYKLISRILEAKSD